MSDERMPERLEQAIAPPGRVAVVVVPVVFALLYGYALFQAISNLVGLPQIYDTFGIPGDPPWAILIAGVAVPVVAFAVAVLLGRGRSLANRALLLVVGLGATNALALGLVAWAQAIQPAFG